VKNAAKGGDRAERLHAAAQRTGDVPVLEGAHAEDEALGRHLHAVGTRRERRDTRHGKGAFGRHVRGW
jgi:hypothetical protein